MPSINHSMTKPKAFDDDVLISDDADLQLVFALFRYALCWMHDESFVLLDLFLIICAFMQ